LEELIRTFLSLTNETLTAATVIITASLLLYNLTRNLGDRVARSSSVVLACVTVTYICDVFISLDPSLQAYEATLRLQWVGIALMPAAMFHLSDALLATTGLPSRGRRRRVIRLLYTISTVFIIAAAFTDILVQPVPQQDTVGLRASLLFPLYLLYFLLATGIAFINVQRARQRCLTRDTRRRMAYLQVAMLTPALGIFPFSVILGPGQEFSLTALVLVNTSNIIVILMLLFLAYPLAFFGSNVPDRVVKTELLRFVLRGPATGLLALVVIIFTTPATRVLGLPGQSFMPFAVVAVVLLWQWIVALALPRLEKILIYPDEDDDQLSKLQNLSEQLLTRSDLLQLMEAILAASCDYLQVNTAFAVSLNEGQPELVATIGPTRPNVALLEDEAEALQTMLARHQNNDTLILQDWHAYWIVPLYSKRRADADQNQALIGFIGVQARSPEVDLTPDEYQMFSTLVRRAAQTLDDLALQTEIYAALEGLLPQINMTRSRAAEVEYRIGRNGATPPTPTALPNREQFIDQVRAALRHYWGGPGLTRSRLLELTVVNNALQENDGNPVRALRAVLNKAIESQRPEGERKMTSPEWLIYNILQLRFIEQRKVREVANRLALAEATLYRKQRDAIEAIADTLLEMEQAETHS
jgi:hypothetical protein